MTSRAVSAVRWRRWALLAVAVITVGSAVVQLAAPEMSLAVMGLSPLPQVAFLFRLVSLLTGLFGAMLLHSLLLGEPPPLLLLWAGAQKVVGAVAVILAALAGLLAAASFAVAGYDLVAGLFLLWCWHALARSDRRSL